MTKRAAEEVTLTAPQVVTVAAKSDGPVRTLLLPFCVSSSSPFDSLPRRAPSFSVAGKKILIRDSPHPGHMSGIRLLSRGARLLINFGLAHAPRIRRFAQRI